MKPVTNFVFHCGQFALFWSWSRFSKRRSAPYDDLVHVVIPSKRPDRESKSGRDLTIFAFKHHVGVNQPARPNHRAEAGCPGKKGPW